MHVFQNTCRDLHELFTIPTGNTLILHNLLHCIFRRDWKVMSKTRASCFIRDSKHVEAIKAPGLRSHAFIYFSVFGTPDETLALVLDMLLQGHFTYISGCVFLKITSKVYTMYLCRDKKYRMLFWRQYCESNGNFHEFSVNTQEFENFFKEINVTHCTSWNFRMICCLSPKILQFSDFFEKKIPVHLP